MPRRPGGGEYPPRSIEAGLRELVMGEGPNVRRLARRESLGLEHLMTVAATPSTWAPDVAAAAVVEVIVEQVQGVANPRWRSAAEAALRLPADSFFGEPGESLAKRWKRRAELDGRPDVEAAKEAFRGYWTACARSLADRLEVVFEEMARDPTSWDRFAKSEPHSPPLMLPISFDRTDVLYRFDGRVGVQSTSYRWLKAHDPVSYYDAVGWYYNEPNAPVEIVPLANCEVNAPIRDLPAGGRTARLSFARTLSSGDEYFFAYTTMFNSSQPCRPTILYEVRGRRMDNLVVRSQFDRAEMPGLCWYFDVEAQSEGWQEPDSDGAQVLEVAPNGYVEHMFRECRRGRKYGLRWLWTD